MDRLPGKIIENEIHAPLLFSKIEYAKWGVFFYNENIPHSHSANHAVILETEAAWDGARFQKILSDIRDFYMAKRLTPRIFFPFSFSYNYEAFLCLEQNGFTVLAQKNIICMVKSRVSDAPGERPLAIREISCWDDRLTDNIIGADHALYMPQVLKCSMASKDYHLFVGHLFEEPASMCALTMGREVSLLDSVMTGIGFRGCGFALKTVCHAVKFYEENFSVPLYLLTDNPSALPIYERAGFSPVRFPDVFYQAFL